MRCRNIRQRKGRRLPAREHGNFADDGFANRPFLRLEHAREWSVAPELQQTEENRSVAFRGRAITPTTVGETQENRQTSRIPGDGAIESLRVVDPGVFCGADTRTVGP